MVLRIFLCMSLFLLGAFSTNSHAHRVRVFAFISGQEIVVEGNFGKGRPALNSEVTIVRSSNREVICKGRTDDKGEYRCPVPAQLHDVPLEVTLDAGQGHQAGWTLEPERRNAVSSVKNALAVHEPAEPRGRLQQHINQDELLRAVEEVVSREIEPLKRMMLEEQDNGPGLQEIIGGIGWIIGIASLLLVIRTQKGGKSE